MNTSDLSVLKKTETKIIDSSPLNSSTLKIEEINPIKEAEAEAEAEAKAEAESEAEAEEANLKPSVVFATNNEQLDMGTNKTSIINMAPMPRVAAPMPGPPLEEVPLRSFAPETLRTTPPPPPPPPPPAPQQPRPPSSSVAPPPTALPLQAYTTQPRQNTNDSTSKVDNLLEVIDLSVKPPNESHSMPVLKLDMSDF